MAIPFRWSRLRRRGRSARRSSAAASNRLGLSGEMLEERRLLTITPALLADINTDSSLNIEGTPSVDESGLIFFGDNFGDLWRTDGTPQGTFFVSHPNIGFFSDPTSIGNTTFFWSGFSGNEIWVSDGTYAGTKSIATFQLGVQPSTIFDVAGTAYFVASDGTHGQELWKSDGTSSGTVMVADINPGSASSGIANLTNADGTLFFTADDGVHGQELWKVGADGTPTIFDVNPGSATSQTANLKDVNGTLFFTAYSAQAGFGLWKVEPGAQAAQQVKGFISQPSLTEFDLTNVDGTLFFGAVSTYGGPQQLWKSDGTAAGTQAIPGGYTLPSGFDQLKMASVGGWLYFFSTDSSSGNEMASLWKTDGTPENTVQVRGGFQGGVDYIYGGGNGHLTAVGNLLMFGANNGTGGEELWKSDGTTAGTVLVNNNGTQFFGNSGTVVGSTLYFEAADSTHHTEVWRSDGTTAGTQMLTRFAQHTDSSTNGYGAAVVPGNDVAYFTTYAHDNSHPQLWKTDGTTAGTVPVKDNFYQIEGSGFGINSHMLTVGNWLYFSASDGVNGDELWRSDGTQTGTQLVADITPGSGGSYPRGLTWFGGKLFFDAGPLGQPSLLYTSDGTAAGTHALAPDKLGSSAFAMLPMGDSLYFTAKPIGSNTLELWKTDGTSEGTVLVRDISAENLINVNGTLYFVGKDPSNDTGSELWKSDGTTAGTVQLKDINPSFTSPGVPASSFPSAFTNVDGTLFFSADDGVHGPELWKSDGTADGTVLVKDIRPSALDGTASLTDLTAVGNQLFFTIDDGVHGRELWKSDGTGAGTTLVKDLMPGSATSSISNLINVNGRLFFTGTDGVHYGLWMSDGYPQGTVFVSDIPIDIIRGGGAANFTVALNRLFFTMDDSVHGMENWTIAPPPVPQLFYNNSHFDGNNPAATADDDAALASDKTAYLPGGGLAGFNNISSSPQGINGLALDFAGSHPDITAADFTFKVGTSNAPDSWSDAPPPSVVSVRAGAGDGGGDRVELVWPDGAIKNTWLQVTVAANSRTGLTDPFVFYFGNRVGDTGTADPSTFALSSAADQIEIRTHSGSDQPITSPYDINRDGAVDGTDESIARQNPGFLPMLNLPVAAQTPLAAPSAATAVAVDFSAATLGGSNVVGEASDLAAGQAVASALAQAFTDDELLEPVDVSAVAPPVAALAKPPQEQAVAQVLDASAAALAELDITLGDSDTNSQGDDSFDSPSLS